jgi:hypothetical protein
VGDSDVQQRLASVSVEVVHLKVALPLRTYMYPPSYRAARRPVSYAACACMMGAEH